MLEPINVFSKVTGYKININNPAAFLHANNKISEKEVKKAILFIIAPKTIKYLEINKTSEH